MRVICHTIDEFLENLSAEPNILQNTVRISICPRPLDGDQRNSIKYEIVLQASAVVCINQMEQYLLEVGISCGVDFKDAEPALEGTEKAESLKQKILEVCKNRALRVMPGVIEI